MPQATAEREMEKSRRPDLTQDRTSFLAEAGCRKSGCVSRKS